MTLYQKDLRKKIEDLVSTLTIRNISWSDWERSFISDMGKKLEWEEIQVSAKQLEIIDRLWEKI